MKKSAQILLAGWLLIFGLIGNAQTISLINSNDVELSNDENSYSIIGDDPFFIFNVDDADSIPSKSVQQYLYFDIEINQQETPMQLFFNEVNGGFDPLYFINFTANNTQFALKIPNKADLNSKHFRLDLNQCRQCIIKLNTLFLSTNKPSSQEKPTPLVKASFVKNGMTNISKTDGLNLINHQWQLNHLEGNLSSFTINGTDPFFSSSLIEVPTQQLGGVYFKLERPNSLQYDSFELFYATQKNRYNPLFRSIARLAPNQSDDGLIELFFPLNFFNNKFPEDKILKRIRLDLPLTKGNWSVKEVILIHRDQLSEFKQFVPNQHLQQKRYRLTGKVLLKDIANNFFQQKGFLILYGLFVLLVAGLFFRAYKK